MLEVIVGNDNKHEVEQNGEHVLIDGNQVFSNVTLLENGLINIIHDNKSYTALIDNIDKKSKEVTFRIDGIAYHVSIKEPMDLLLEEMGMDLSALQKAEPVKAPMPGMILKVLVEPGQQIAKGDGLLVLEAMKMENVLKATADGTVKAINCKERTAVEKGAVLIEME